MSSFYIDKPMHGTELEISTPCSNMFRTFSNLINLFILCLFIYALLILSFITN